MSNPKKEGPMASNDTKIALLEQSIGHINQTLERIEKRFDKIDSELGFAASKLDNQFLVVDNKLSEMYKKIDSKFSSLDNRIWALFFFIIAGFGSVLGVIAKVAHWY
jgi:predicted  nucleic acid-binding Zn-ribbon protein